MRQRGLGSKGMAHKGISRDPLDGAIVQRLRITVFSKRSSGKNGVLLMYPRGYPHLLGITEGWKRKGLDTEGFEEKRQDGER